MNVSRWVSISSTQHTSIIKGIHHYFLITVHTIESLASVFHRVISILFIHLCLLAKSLSLPLLDMWWLSAVSGIQTPEDFELSASSTHRVLELFNSPANENDSTFWLIAKHWGTNMKAKMSKIFPFIFIWIIFLGHSSSSPPHDTWAVLHLLSLHVTQSVPTANDHK